MEDHGDGFDRLPSGLSLRVEDRRGGRREARTTDAGTRGLGDAENRMERRETGERGETEQKSLTTDYTNHTDTGSPVAIFVVVAVATVATG